MNYSTGQELLSKANETLRGEWGRALPIFIVYFVISGLIGQIPYLGGAASLIISGPLSLGLSILVLHIIRDQDYRMEDIFEGFKNFETSLITYLLMLGYVILYLLLLIVPGVIKAISYSQVFYILADNPDLTPKEVLDRSERMMDGHKMRYFMMSLLFFVVMIICIIPLGLGLFWLIPVASVAFGNFYQELSGRDLEDDELDISEHLV